MTPIQELRKLSVKDLINVGIFTLLYIVVLVVLGQLGALLPLTQVLGPLYIPFACGIPFMLFLTRVKSFGMVSIMGILVGLLLLLTGQSYWGLILSVILGPAADLVFRAGGYKSWKHTLIGYIVFSEILIANVFPLFFWREAWLERLRGRNKSEDWINQIVAMTPNWMFIGMMVMLAVGAVAGAFLGRALLRKHFERAGIA
ncbi:MAG: MptD family putative ECF transporter S component [Propionibacteriaceae bacterium]|nr:MptD family putative ECF transporter S component [Propionibacteriaceae bacterium]